MIGPKGEGFNMAFATRSVVLGLCSLMVFPASGRGEEKKPLSSGPAPGCTRNLDDYFAKEVWAKVGSVLCMNCHKVGGDAEKSKFILQDPSKAQGHAQDE